VPEFLADGGPTATQNGYVPLLTLGPASGVKRIYLSVLSAAACLVQCWRYTDPGCSKWELETVERTVPGQSIGVTFSRCAGVQIRSAAVGVPAVVVAELVYEGDVEIAGGGITSATISSSGAIV
jgi:hypothetical protein